MAPVSGGTGLPKSGAGASWQLAHIECILGFGLMRILERRIGGVAAAECCASMIR
jgi:hypothetical protein